MDSLRKSGYYEICAIGSQIKLPILVQCASLRSHKASRITWHSHDFYEILLVIEGATEYEFDDGHTVALSGGRFLSIAPGVRHRGKHDVRSPARLFGIQFNPSAKHAGRNLPFTPKEAKWLTQQIKIGAGHSHRFSTDIRWQINSLCVLLENIASSDDASLMAIRLALCGILLEVARQCSSSANLEPTQVVQIAMEYMKCNLGSEKSIESVAKAARCSRAKLFAVFKDSTGMTPNDYWLRLRINHAKELMKTTNESITSIAMQSGFSSSQYFSAVFRKYAGTSPSDYRVTD